MGKGQEMPRRKCVRGPLSPCPLPLAFRLGPLALRYSPLIAEGEHEDSHHNHGKGEKLAHGEGSEDKTKLGIRLANKLYHQPAQPIAGDKTPDEGAGWRHGFRDDP